MLVSSLRITPLLYPRFGNELLVNSVRQFLKWRKGEAEFIGSFQSRRPCKGRVVVCGGFPSSRGQISSLHVGFCLSCPPLLQHVPGLARRLLSSPWSAFRLIPAAVGRQHSLASTIHLAFCISSCAPVT